MLTRVIMVFGTLCALTISVTAVTMPKRQAATPCEDGSSSVVATGTIVRVMRDGTTGHVVFFDFQTGNGPASWKKLKPNRWRRAILSEEVYGMMVESGDAGRLFKEGKRVQVRGCPGETYPPDILVNVRGISSAK